MKKTDLRQQAEETLSKRKKSLATDADSLRLIHELEVHQIELEMQNEQLIQARAEAEETHRQYTDLYDFAPVGYFTLARDGTILMSNLTGANLLGAERSKLVKRRFGVFVSVESRPAFSGFLEKIFSSAGNQACEITLLKDGTNPLWVRLDGVCSEDGLECRVVMKDITERKQAEEALRALSARQEAILLAVPDILMEVDQNKVYTWANSAGLAFFGEDVIGKEAAFYFEGEQDTYGIVKPLFNGSEDVIYVESWQRRKDGSKQLLAWWCRVLKDARGNAAGALSSAHDITERKQAEEALRTSEEKFKAIANYAVSWESWFGPDGKYVWVNPAVEHFTGYAAQEILAMPDFISTVIADEDRSMFINRFQEAIRGNQGENFEFRYLHKNGAQRWLSASWHPIYDERGNPLGTRSSGYDITERKQAEEIISSYVTRLNLSMKAANMAWWEMDISTGHVIFDERKTDMLGYSSEKFQHYEDFMALVHPDDHDKAMKAMQAHFAGAVGKYEVEYRILTKSGEYKWFHDIGAIEKRDSQGAPLTVAGLVLDISERKQAEEALRESQEKFRIAQDMSPDGFTILRPVRDAQGQVVDFTWIYENAAVARLNGTDPEAVVGRRLLDLFPGHRGTPFLKAYQQVAESGEVCIFESGYSGESMTKPAAFRIVVVPMVGDIAILAQDITERKQAEEEIKKQLDELQRWHNATLGREMRVLELKREVNELLGQASQPPRYPSAET